MKRIVAVVLCAALLFSALPVVQAADPVTQQQIEAHLEELIGLYNDQTFTEDYHGATTCKGFADMLYATLFGVDYIGPYITGDYYYLDQLDPRVEEVGRVTQVTVDSVRNLLSQALPGDYVQLRRPSNYGHSMIVKSVDGNGVTFFHSNWSHLFTNELTYFTWAEFAGICTAFSLYHYINYLAAPVTNSEAIPPLEEPTGKFIDVPDKAWYHDVVLKAADLGLMNGTSATQFSPEGKMNRAMLVTVLYRLDGQEQSYETDFVDVEDARWYTDPVGWAQENGIVNGYADGTFRPTANITRQDTATILHRYAVYKNYTCDQVREIDAFIDASDVALYATPAVEWATGCTILSGNPDGSLRPRNETTRAQLAKMIIYFQQIYASLPEDLPPEQ